MVWESFFLSIEFFSHRRLLRKHSSRNQNSKLAARIWIPSFPLRIWLIIPLVAPCRLQQLIVANSGLPSSSVSFSVYVVVPKTFSEVLIGSDGSTATESFVSKAPVRFLHWNDLQDYLAAVQRPRLGRPTGEGRGSGNLRHPTLLRILVAFQ